MELKFILVLVAALLLLGCYSAPNIVGGSESPIITTSKNFTMKEGWQESFRLVTGNSTTSHKLTISSMAPNAAMLKIDGKQILLRVGETSSVSLNGKTVNATLNSINEGYARFTISVSSQTPPSQQGGQQNDTQGGQQKLQNGVNCTGSSQCQSNYCSNGYCCASGSCCISDANCSIGKCNTTTYSCYAIALLSNGAPCNSNKDCQSNYCSNGYCCASGKCCLSNSNCASGEVCNTTTSSCVQAAVYSAAAAEAKANSTAAGLIISRFASIFNSARQCAGASDTYKQCVPAIAVREDKVSASTYRVIYSYSFTGVSCCPNTDVLVITVELTTNATTTQWIDKSITSALADSMESNLNSNCATAVQYIACKPPT